jgi:Pyridoxamine 5'-phosphate oxidase
MRVIRDRPRSVDVDELLARPLFAHLATASDEGPRESPVWFLWEDEAIWILGSRRTDTFPARLEHDPRCALGIVDFDREEGLVHHVGMRGRASIEAFDPDRARRLLARYLGADADDWDKRFLDTLTDPDNLFVRFVPESVVARDVSYERRGGRAREDADPPG